MGPREGGARQRARVTKGRRLRFAPALAVVAAVAAVLAAVAPAAAALPPKQDAALDYGGGKRAAPVVLGGIRHSPLDALVRTTVKPHLPVVFAPPPSYDLRTRGRLSPIRDQDPYGTCWAFATYGSLESCLLPGEAWDFSENNLVWFSGFDSEPYNGGGNYWMSTAYLARWDGPVTEADDPYGSGTHPEPATLSKAKHVQEVLILPSKQGASCDAIKQALMTHGAVATTMYSLGMRDYMSGDAYYYPAAGGQSPDHAVAIVGWDDAYPAGSFRTRPPGDGAFIVRNSWGSGWGDGGYFYASYYDKHIGVSAWCFSGAEPPTNYDHIYQYDPLGCVTSWGYGTPTVWLANAFTATASGSIDAVSVYTFYTGTTYQVLAGTTPQTMTVRGSGTLTNAGYHTISLSTPLPVARGRSFAVGVKLTSGSGETYLIPIEMPDAGYSMDAEASPGQSFFSLDGSTWYDATDEIHSEANICLKAFGRIAGLEPPSTAISSGHDPRRWHNRDVVLKFTITGQSRLDALLYTFNPSKWQELDLAGHMVNDEGTRATPTATVQAKKDHSVDGDWTLYYKARDKAGRIEAQQSTSIKIDTRRPTVKAPKATNARRGATATLRYAVADTKPCAGKATVTIKVRAGNGKGKLVKTLKLGTRPAKGALQNAKLKVPKKWKRGTYRFYVYATDAAGNVQVRVAANRLVVR